MEKNTIIWVCAECGSTKVEAVVWVDANTGKYSSNGCDEYEDRWCVECQSHTDFCTKEEFEEKMDDWARENGLAWTEGTDYEQKRKTYKKLTTHE